MATTIVRGDPGFSLRLTIRRVAAVVATAAVLVAPFTWSYVASVGGILIRAVDLLLLTTILLMALRFRLARFPILVPACLLGVICLKFLRGAILSDGAAVVSGIKIGYYLVSALVMATVFREISKKWHEKSTIYAILLVSPIFFVFLTGLANVFLDFLQTSSLASLSKIVFSGWHEIFSENMFGVSDSLEVRGVGFRNSAGISFLVAALFFFLWDGMINRIVMICLMIIAAMMFSRSVWLIQLFFLALIILSSNNRNRALGFFMLIGAAITICVVPGLSEALNERLQSGLGRSEMLALALDEFNANIFMGNLEGGHISLAYDQEKSVHNVPLALALETGILGFLLSIIISAAFFLSAVTRFYYLLAWKVDEPNKLIVVILVSSILFMRPMVSASFDIYFSIGEWCALAIFFAFANKTRWSSSKCGSSMFHVGREVRSAPSPSNLMCP